MSLDEILKLEEKKGRDKYPLLPVQSRMKKSQQGKNKNHTTTFCQYYPRKIISVEERQQESWRKICIFREIKF